MGETNKTIHTTIRNPNLFKLGGGRKGNVKDATIRSLLAESIRSQEHSSATTLASGTAIALYVAILERFKKGPGNLKGKPRLRFESFRESRAKGSPVFYEMDGSLTAYAKTLPSPTVESTSSASSPVTRKPIGVATTPCGGGPEGFGTPIGMVEEPPKVHLTYYIHTTILILIPHILGAHAIVDRPGVPDQEAEGTYRQTGP